MSKFKIIVSDRCFFPWSAFRSSRKIVQLAKSLGYKQVEFHPTWAVCWEALTKGRLSCKAGDICSFHISWREDGVGAGLGFLKRTLMPTYMIFPFKPLGAWVLQKLEKVYDKEAVVHWPWDFKKYKKPILELHSFLEIDFEKVKALIGEKKIKGVVVDTDKLAGWCKRHKGDEGRVLKELFPFVKEVHFRFGHRRDIGESLDIERSNSARIIKKLLRLGYKGRVVVEFGWPDKESIKILKRDGFENIHKKIIGFLQSLKLTIQTV